MTAILHREINGVIGRIQILTKRCSLGEDIDLSQLNNLSHLYSQISQAEKISPLNAAIKGALISLHRHLQLLTTALRDQQALLKTQRHDFETQSKAIQSYVRTAYNMTRWEH